VSAPRLVPLASEHLPMLEPVTHDPDVLRFTRVPDPPPPGFVEDWYAGYERGRAEGTREAYLVVPEARGRGVATAALSMLGEWAFDHLGALRIELLINIDNPGSQAVAARCGYVREGVLRSTHFKGNLRQDVELWSLLPDDPRPVSPA